MKKEKVNGNVVEMKNQKVEAKCNRIDNYTVSIAQDYGLGYELRMTHIGDRTKKSRAYILREWDRNGKRYEGEFDEDRIISISEIDNCSSRIKDMILEGYGRYRDVLGDIVKNMLEVETERKLKIRECLGGDQLREDELWGELKDWLLLNSTDPRVVCLEIKNKMEIGFRGLDEAQEVFKSINSGTSFKMVKMRLKEKGWLKTDSEMSRYTRRIEKGVALKENLGTTSIFNLNFDDDKGFVEEFMKVREEKKKAENQ